MTPTSAALSSRNDTAEHGNASGTATSESIPLCEMCLKNHKTTPATEVHHIRPLSRGGTHDEDNLMALCKPCHSKITAEMDDRWHHARKEYHYE